MVLDLQNKLYMDNNLRRFLYEESYWYKYLNRDPESFKEFVNAMKDKYQLKTSDKINKMLNNIGMLQTFLDVLK
jgi:hypothetical protein